MEEEVDVFINILRGFTVPEPAELVGDSYKRFSRLSSSDCFELNPIWHHHTFDPRDHECVSVCVWEASLSEEQSDVSHVGNEERC